MSLINLIEAMKNDFDCQDMKKEMNCTKINSNVQLKLLKYFN